jgi:uncharacterized damage-inducible protein DinB
MSIANGLLAELEHEAKITRELLSRVPANPGWKPHPKSMAMGRLAGHIAELARWGSTIVNEDVFVMDPTKYTALSVKTGKEAVDAFDKGVLDLKKALAGKSDAEMLKTWKMIANGKTFIEMQRAAVMRGMVMNHMVHHRAQLGLYLRLNDVALPQTYGPSADEGGM